MRVGVNTYGLRDAFHEDFDGTLRELAEIGVEELEPCVSFIFNPIILTAIKLGDKSGTIGAGIWTIDLAKENIKKARTAGFHVDIVHPMCIFKKPKDLEKLIPRFIDFAKEVDVHYLVLSPMKSGKELLAYADTINKTIEAFEKEDIHLVLHNHEEECIEYLGMTSMEALMEKCPDLTAEVDVGWVKYAGVDAVELLGRLNNRLGMVHFKDVKVDASPETRDTCFTTIGEGSIPLKEIVLKVHELGFDEMPLIIDQDDSEGRMLDDIALGVKNIKEEMTWL